MNEDKNTETAEKYHDEHSGELSPTLKVLNRLRNDVFKGSDSELALALGRPLEEVEAWQRETEEIDEDAEMKIYGLAEERLSK